MLILWLLTENEDMGESYDRITYEGHEKGTHEKAGTHRSYVRQYNATSGTATIVTVTKRALG